MTARHRSSGSLLTLGSLLMLSGCASGSAPTAPTAHTAHAAPAHEGPPSGGLAFEAAFPPPDPAIADRLSEFVRRIHHDQSGRYWFGTNGDGVLRYDGTTLEQFTEDDGLAGFAVRAIVEEADGTLWLGTNGGVTQVSGESFTTLREPEGLPNRDVWSLFIDRDGVLWVGTYGGAARRNPETGRFEPVELPLAPGVDPTRGVTSRTMVNAITQDAEGAMWFAVGIGGVHRVQAGTITSLNTSDGLIGDSVNDVLVDARGHVWFATHHHGVCRFDGTRFEDVLADEGLDHLEAWSLYEDREGNVWFPVEGAGLYRHDGRRLRLFTEADGLPSVAIQCVHEDADGRIWAGGYGGLVRLDGERFVRVGRSGPWTAE